MSPLCQNGHPQHDYPLYTLPLWGWGHSVVFPMYKAVLQAIGARPGDMLIARVHPPYLTIRVAHPERIIPIDTFGPEVLPPSWPGKDDNATTPESASSAVVATTKPDSSDHHR